MQDRNTGGELSTKENTTMIAGTILHYNQERGYGFILENGTKTHYFFHLSSCDFLPTVGLQVLFDPTQGRKGIIATSVTQAVGK
jgi:CspA family cold shock protein